MQLSILAELMFFSHSVLQKHQQCPAIRNQMQSILSEKNHQPDDIVQLFVDTPEEREELRLLIYNLNRILEQMIDNFSSPERVQITIDQKLAAYPDQLKENIKNSITDTYINRLKCFQEWVYLITVQLKEGVSSSGRGIRRGGGNPLRERQLV